MLQFDRVFEIDECFNVNRNDYLWINWKLCLNLLNMWIYILHTNPPYLIHIFEKKTSKESQILDTKPAILTFKTHCWEFIGNSVI